MATVIHSDLQTDRADESPRSGKVFLIGAGPGDPDLITVKGLRYLRKADVVLYDRLVSPLLLEETRSGVVQVFVGKGPRHHVMEQEEINALLISYARQGCNVVRLKGGDPFIFGRGGEEAVALAQAGIAFEIIPGVTSATAVPAYAGIPVTHRDYASSVTIVTGHEGQSHGSDSPNWEMLARTNGTLVILMGVKHLPAITKQLIAGGLDPTIPAAVIQNGTLHNQRVVTGTVATIVAQVMEAKLSAPAITVIGKVVSLRDVMAWYENECSLHHLLHTLS